MKVAPNTIINSEGKILFYSLKDFHDRIVNGTDCFICGAENTEKIFNLEHVLPDWLLKRFSLQNKSITLSNQATYKYGKYKVRCCEECNRELGDLIEIPVSKLLKLPYQDICDTLKKDPKNFQLLFHWLMLIFFKVYLKDTEFNWYLDTRKGTEKISDVSNFEQMHHIHCMVRTHYTKAIIDTKVMGSILILPAIEHPTIEPFDYADHKEGSAIMMRINQFCIVCILNDSCGSSTVFTEYLSKIKGPLTPFQLKEVFTHLLFINLHLKKRPIYYSAINAKGDYHIKAKIPKIVELIDEKDWTVSHGELLHHYCKDMIGGENRDTLLNEIKEGKRRYLFNDKGEFVDYSKELK